MDDYVFSNPAADRVSKVCDRFQVALYCVSIHINGALSGATLGYDVRKFECSHSQSTLWLRREYDFKFFELVRLIPSSGAFGK